MKNKTEIKKGDGKMKLNFLNVLKGKSPSSDVAEQIVLLERKFLDVEKDKGKLKESAKELRQRKLCGEEISDAQIKDADTAVKDIDLTIEAITESVTKLKEKLNVTLEDEKEAKRVNVGETNKELCAERKMLNKELARYHARFLAFAETIFGGLADVYMKDGRMFRFNGETRDVFEDELAKAKSAIKHPTHYEKNLEYERIWQWILKFDLNKEVELIMEKRRGKIR